MFSYSRDFCGRSHRRYTMCGSHYSEQHRGAGWRQCLSCKATSDLDPWYAENGYNVSPRLDRPKGECMCAHRRCAPLTIPHARVCVCSMVQHGAMFHVPATHLPRQRGVLDLCARPIVRALQRRPAMRRRDVISSHYLNVVVTLPADGRRRRRQQDNARPSLGEVAGASSRGHAHARAAQREFALACHGCAVHHGAHRGQEDKRRRQPANGQYVVVCTCVRYMRR